MVDNPYAAPAAEREAPLPKWGFALMLFLFGAGIILGASVGFAGGYLSGWQDSSTKTLYHIERMPGALND